MNSYDKHKKQTYTCKKCEWSGIGEQMDTGWKFSYQLSKFCYEIRCPECGELVDAVIEARLTPELLPEIDADEIIISLREEGKGHGKNHFKNAFIVLYWGEQEIWREHLGFEYYADYLSMGKILKEKYGKRLVDFEAVYTANLGGDHGGAFDKVRAFRKSLSNKGEMDNN